MIAAQTLGYIRCFLHSVPSVFVACVYVCVCVCVCARARAHLRLPTLGSHPRSSAAFAASATDLDHSAELRRELVELHSLIPVARESHPAKTKQ